MASSSTSGRSAVVNYGSQEYPYPSHVNPAGFLSIKLSGESNYDVWQEQMMCLVYGHDMLGFIDGTLECPRENRDCYENKAINNENVMEAKYREWKRSDTLVKGWIFGSLSQDVMVTIAGLHTAHDVWVKLNTTYSTPAAVSTTTTNNKAGSQEYPYPSHVNPASFLSIKLSSEGDENNYDVWQEQMMCLVDGHDMLGFIDGTFTSPQEDGDPENKAKYREWKRSDTLVKGWIFGSVSEDVMDDVAGLQTAHDVWKKLNTTYCTPDSPTGSPTRDKDMAEYVPLHRALLMGDWEKAQEIFNKDKDAFTAKLSEIDEHALDIVVGTGRNFQLVENLLKEINPESLPTLVDSAQFNALHRAAIVGNTIAAKMVVEKNPHLLFIPDEDEYLPIHRAIINSHKRTFQYLLVVSKQYIEFSQQDGYQSPFEGKNGVLLINEVISAGLFDVASKLIQEFPDMARKGDGINNNALSFITNKSDAYFSGTRYNFYQRFLYSHVPIEKNNLGDADKIQDIENQATNKTKFFTMPRRFCFIPVIQTIYIKFWKLALLQVPHIKRLHEDKVKHNAALMLLKCICEEVGKLNSFSGLSEHYGEAYTLAVQNDTPEAVEAIVGCFPRAIWVTRGDYRISQIAITNRCEKVYNFLVNQVDDKHLHRTSTDQNDNNLLHLAGQLAPIHKLNLVSGAALQMQRELQWFQEVKKFVLPTYEEKTNDKTETPMMVFRREHKELRKEGEEWMKKTADSYTITTALIITIAFAAAITVPGGNNGNTGKAIYATKASFIIFAVSDAISLFTSTTSLLLFLSILTARYREEDFLYRLPKRLILGLAMLFLSVTSMIIAFSAILYLLFGEGKPWILIPIAALTCLPIASFVTLQFPLLVELIDSTYGRGIFVKARNRRVK